MKQGLTTYVAFLGQSSRQINHRIARRVADKRPGWQYARTHALQLVAAVGACYDARMWKQLRRRTASCHRTALARVGALIGDSAIVLLAAGCAQNEIVAAAPVTPVEITQEAVALVSPSVDIAASPVTLPMEQSAAAASVTVPPTEVPAVPPTVASTVMPAVTPALSIAALLPTPTPTVEPATPVSIEPTPDGVARQMRVPVLMYHYLSTPPDDADIYRRDLSVPPELFADHLDRLLAEGYAPVSLYQVIDSLQRGAPLPQKPVVITFDDGYRDNYVNAFPLLKERGMPATIFVVTDFMDEERPEYLTWAMAREMLAAGISIESHGRNHVSLESKDDDYLVWQALGSLETIEHELGVRPRFVSYPAGEYDQRTIDVFRSAHYWAGFTTQQGANLDNQRPFELPRIRVRNTTTPDDLIRLLSLDW